MIVALVAVAPVAVADSAPRIVSVTPSTGTSGGGDTVIVQTADILLTCALCSPSVPPGVTFDGEPAMTSLIDDTHISVLTPPHDPGTVDVTVYGVGEGAIATLHGGFTYVAGLRAANFAAFLVPAPLVGELHPLAGAHGSQWVSELWFRNNSYLPGLVFSGFEACEACEVPTAPKVAPSQQTGAITTTAPVAGLMIYASVDIAADLSFAMRVRDVSRSASNDGTTLPVVSTGQFRPSSINLLNVPINSTSRAALRVFARDASLLSEERATIKVWRMSVDLPGQDVLIASGEVVLTPSQSLATDFVAVPANATLNDFRTSLAPGSAIPDGSYRVEIIPNTFYGWAYISVTNNDTQLVTAITPR